MIDYLTVIYKNYDLLELQREQFSKLGFTDYRLIVVDNTPVQYFSQITPSDNELIIRRENNGNEFDGVSHGSALDLGLTYCTSDIVCIFDSDYFFLQNVETYIIDKFNQGYKAVGAEFWNLNAYPEFVPFYHLLDNIPCCFCGYYSREDICGLSWIITPEEIDRSSGYIEVGYRIRKHINETGIKTFGWKCEGDNNSINNFLYKDEYGNPIGFHVVAGSHRNSYKNMKAELSKYESINITHLQ